MSALPSILEPHASLLSPALNQLDELDAEGLLAAPVDLEAMVQHGVELRPRLDGQKLELSEPTCVVVTGDVTVETLVLEEPSVLLVLGNLKARSARLYGTVLVLGTCEVAESLVGHGEPHTLTVLGAVQAGRCEMHQQYIMQFLGGGTLASLSDSEGGEEELLELMQAAGSELQIGA
ncbi:polymer-forming cytoskeletal protein [Archangium lansingense]|uniref:Polymer-forming cytoskeletal protein n=1 Tax=Archangium lansingense TaxID=2995310 RepID=A0ABT4ANT1_9BACT|nr:polymer-forming cytoskeletal protein [Archangium lansinium]MCY1083357.1 polymer-forming cytoskeletal protein [Archangium lansinium]